LSDELDAKLYCALCGTEGAPFICEKCGLTLCLWCVKTEKPEFAICKTCGSFEISKGKNNKLFCLKCNCEKVGVGSKIQRHCPACKGEVQHVSQVKKKVVSRFLGAVNVFKRIGLQFVKLCTTWEDLRTRIQTLRQANYYHYPLLEEKLCTVSERLPEDRRFVLKQIQQLATTLKAGATHFIGSTYSSIENVGKKMQQLVSLEKELEIVSATVSERLRVDIEVLDHLKRLVEKIERVRNHFDRLQDTLPMSPFELPVMVLPNAHVSDFRTLDGSKSSGVGLLCLTNSRLIFICIKGVVRRTKHIRDLQINHVEQVSPVTNKRKMQIIITTSLGTISIRGKKKDLEEMHAFLGIARAWNEEKVPRATVAMPSIEKMIKDYRACLSDLFLNILKNKEEILDESKSEYSTKQRISYLKREIAVLRRTIRDINKKFARGDIPMERYTRMIRGLISELDRLNGELNSLYRIDLQRVDPFSRVETLIGDFTPSDRQELF